jgi:membrane associated rhomboid family serine protease
MPTCYRHPDRETGVSCSNCGRPICTDCMTPTPVGMRCPECSRDRTKVHTMGSLTVEPRVTYALIAMNVIVFIGASLSGTSLVGGGGSELFRHGALIGIGGDGSGLFGVAQGEYWRLLTGGFLHAGLLHLGFNMYVLYWLGNMLEPTLGHVRFLAVYLASLLAGSFGALLLAPASFTVGASGAVFGLMGAAFILERARGRDPMQSGIGFVILLNLGLTFVIGNISIGGHIGGLIGGTLVALAMTRVPRTRSAYPTVAICTAVAALSVVGGIWASVSERVELTGAVIGLLAG